MKRILHAVNLPRVVANHVVGKDHSVRHRMLAGLAVMAVGVGVAKSANVFEFAVWHFSVDLLGYAIHGLGLTPYIEWVLKAEVES